MSANDQPDGFFDDGHKSPNCEHPECQPFEVCHAALAPQKGTHSGRIVGHQKDLFELTHGAVGFRLAKGFSMLRASER